MEYLNFNEICGKVSFKQVLDWLDIPYEETQTGEYKGQAFIINKAKNVYFNPVGSDKGSVINLVSAINGIDLRSAAKLIKDRFLAPEKPGKEPKRPIPELTLEYHPYLEKLGIPPELCKELNVGCPKGQKTMMAGYICFKPVGQPHYIGYHPEKNKWYFPPTFVRSTLWNIQNCDHDIIFVVKDCFTALSMIAQGYRNTASIMGPAPTEEQSKIVSRFKVALSDY